MTGWWVDTVEELDVGDLWQPVHLVADDAFHELVGHYGFFLLGREELVALDRGVQGVLVVHHSLNLR